MAGRHTATAGPLSLPTTLSDLPGTGSLTRAGIAAALVTASAAAVAGSTGAFAAAPAPTTTTAGTALMSLDTASAHDASTAGVSHAAVSPVAMSSAAPAQAGPAVKSSSPISRQAAADQKAAADREAAQKDAAKKAAADKKSADAKDSDSASSGVSSAGPMGDRIVNEASQFKGTPYVWGGTTPDGFDCSGFTRYVFKQMGISLPRTAQQQYDAVQHISESQAQPGDLVFMGGSNSIYHVAIYAGNGKIWTAPEPGQSVKLGNMFGSVHYGRAR